jgi:hypothetical protein
VCRPRVVYQLHCGRDGKPSVVRLVQGNRRYKQYCPGDRKSPGQPNVSSRAWTNDTAPHGGSNV